MNFSLTVDHQRIQGLCRELATDFATRAATHDREASAPVENYEALRAAGLFGLTVPKALGGWGSGLLGYAIAVEELAQGCAATAMSFNMHCGVVHTLTTAEPLSLATRQRVANLVIHEKKLIAALLSEPGTTNLLYSTRACSTQARRVSGGYTLVGKKAFATMVEAADYAAIFAHPDDEANPESAIPALVSINAPGMHIERVWDTLGMRATRSDNVILDHCFVPAEMVFDDLWIPSAGDFLAANESAINLPIPRCTWALDVPSCARWKRTCGNATQGYAQPLAYHADIRRRVAKMVRNWKRRGGCSGTQPGGGYRRPDASGAGRVLQGEIHCGGGRRRGNAVGARDGGAHALIKGAPIERLFRDGATATMMQPSSDVCLAELSIYQLQLERRAIQPPLARLA